MDLLMFWTPSPVELVVIAFVALLLFGGRLPKIARGLGQSVVELKRGLKEVSADVEEVGKELKKTE